MNPIHFCSGVLLGWLVGMGAMIFLIACCRVSSDAERGSHG